MEGLTTDRFTGAGSLADRPRAPVRVVLDNLRSAFNVGSIFRTSDAARVEHLHLCGITPTPPHRQLARTSLGATRHVPWSSHPDAAAVVRALAARGHQIVALEITPEAESYLDAPLQSPLALVLGHEVLGISGATLAEADRIVRIPMFGVKNSINVATSYGIVIFEILRRLGYPSPTAAGDCT